MTKKIGLQAAWRDFLHNFANHIMQVSVSEKRTRRATVVSSKNLVAWADDHLHHVQLRRYPWPGREGPKATGITRIALNAHAFSPSALVLTNLGFDGEQVPSTSELRLEWSLLTQELLEFAVWLPAWIHGQIDPKFVIPSPPHPSHVWGGNLRLADYAWTVAAWQAYEKGLTGSDKP